MCTNRGEFVGVHILLRPKMCNFLTQSRENELFPAQLANEQLKTSAAATADAPHLQQTKHQSRRLPCGTEAVAGKRSLLSANIRTELPQGFDWKSTGTNRGETKQKQGGKNNLGPCSSVAEFTGSRALSAQESTLEGPVTEGQLGRVVA